MLTVAGLTSLPSPAVARTAQRIRRLRRYGLTGDQIAAALTREGVKPELVVAGTQFLDALGAGDFDRDIAGAAVTMAAAVAVGALVALLR